MTNDTSNDTEPQELEAPRADITGKAPAVIERLDMTLLEEAVGDRDPKRVERAIGVVERLYPQLHTPSGKKRRFPVKNLSIDYRASLRTEFEDDNEETVAVPIEAAKTAPMAVPPGAVPMAVPMALTPEQRQALYYDGLPKGEPEVGPHLRNLFRE